jgi:hypothetical protein
MALVLQWDITWTSTSCCGCTMSSNEPPASTGCSLPDATPSRRVRAVDGARPRGGSPRAHGRAGELARFRARPPHEPRRMAGGARRDEARLPTRSGRDGSDVRRQLVAALGLERTELDTLFNRRSCSCSAEQPHDAAEHTAPLPPRPRGVRSGVALAAPQLPPAGGFGGVVVGHTTAEHRAVCSAFSNFGMRSTHLAGHGASHRISARITWHVGCSMVACNHR